MQPRSQERLEVVGTAPCSTGAVVGDQILGNGHLDRFLAHRRRQFGRRGRGEQLLDVGEEAALTHPFDEADRKQRVPAELEEVVATAARSTPSTSLQSSARITSVSPTAASYPRRASPFRRGCRCGGPGDATALGRPRTAPPTGYPGRHNRLTHPSPNRARLPRPRPIVRRGQLRERDDVRAGGSGSNVLRDQYELVDGDERPGPRRGAWRNDSREGPRGVRSWPRWSRRHPTTIAHGIGHGDARGMESVGNKAVISSWRIPPQTPRITPRPRESPGRRGPGGRTLVSNRRPCQGCR